MTSEIKINKGKKVISVQILNKGRLKYYVIYIFLGYLYFFILKLYNLFYLKNMILAILIFLLYFFKFLWVFSNEEFIIERQKIKINKKILGYYYKKEIKFEQIESLIYERGLFPKILVFIFSLLSCEFLYDLKIQVKENEEKSTQYKLSSSLKNSDYEKIKEVLIAEFEIDEYTFIKDWRLKIILLESWKYLNIRRRNRY